MLQFEYIETGRLRLRKVSFEDRKFLFDNCSDEELKALFQWDEESLKLDRFKHENGQTTYRSTYCIFYLIEKESNRIIGDMALHNWFPIHRRAELGYAMRNDEHKRKGYMKEAARAVVKYGFEKMDLNRIEAIVAPYNEASLRIVKGLGFEQEGYLRQHYFYEDKFDDSLIFGLLKKDFDHNNA